MTQKKDYYEVLGVGKSATDVEVKKSYRKLAHKYHPDKGEGDDVKFKEVGEAYQILSDPQKRKMYDQFGHAGPAGAGGPGGAGFNWSDFANQGGGQGFQGNVNFEDLGGFGDIFEQFFGGGGGRGGRKEQRGSDLETTMTIDFKDAVFGATKEINLDKYNVCDRCNGEGSEPGTSRKICPTCKGKGDVEIAQKTILGNILRRQTCPDCQGEGKIPEKKCTKCRGEGRSREKEKVSITIPSGIDSGESIRFTGKGEAGPKGARQGDLYVRIRVRTHSDYRREGANIVNSTEITFPEAALGTTVEVPTVDGKVTLKIPSGTQSEKVFKLSGKGVPYGGRRGDHLVQVIVKTPDRLSKKQKDLLEQFQNEGSETKRRWFG